MSMFEPIVMPHRTRTPQSRPARRLEPRAAFGFFRTNLAGAVVSLSQPTLASSKISGGDCAAVCRKDARQIA